MSNENEMNVKYQQHYTKILNATLTDTILKSVSYQANIQLANEIIAEQEKTIGDLQSNVNSSKKELQDTIDNLKKELEVTKNSKTASENTRIVGLENAIKNNQATISKLNADLIDVNKLKIDNDNLKQQINQLNVFKTEVVKTREDLKNIHVDYSNKISGLTTNYENKIDKLKLELDNLKAPLKKTKKTTVKKVVKSPIKNIEVEEVQDGGSF
jgi:DNA repair exonuclease SbcCD ATPase subunit